MFSTLLIYFVKRDIKQGTNNKNVITLTALIVDGLEKEYLAYFKDFYG